MKPPLVLVFSPDVTGEMRQSLISCLASSFSLITRQVDSPVFVGDDVIPGTRLLKELCFTLGPSAMEPDRLKSLLITRRHLVDSCGNRLYGLSELGGNVGVVSIAGLDSKEACAESWHEVGHLWGLDHCQDPACAMAFSSGEAGLLQKAGGLCRACMNELEFFMEPEGALGVSKCLLGENCRFDGKNCKDPDVLKYVRGKKVVGICPEEMGGLSTPRERSEIVSEYPVRVETATGKDVTEAFKQGALAALDTLINAGVRRCILKEGSPSCGSRLIHSGKFDGKRIPGRGLTTRLLDEHGVRVVSEEAVRRRGYVGIEQAEDKRPEDRG
ncbi:MAG: 2-thiouracil desulfurase family protein [Bacillota bacterium]